MDGLEAGTPLGLDSVGNPHTLAGFLKKILKVASPAISTNMQENSVAILKEHSAVLFGVECELKADCQEEKVPSLVPKDTQALLAKAFAKPSTPDEQVYFCKLIKIHFIHRYMYICIQKALIFFSACVYESHLFPSEIGCLDVL